MKRISEYKELARQSMKGSYGQGVALLIGVSLAQSILSSIFTAMAGTSQVMNIAYMILNLIIATIIFNPLLVGLSKFFLEQAQGRVDMKNVISPFNTNLTNIVKIGFFRDIKLILWMLPSIVVAFAAVAFMGMDAYLGTPAITMCLPIIMLIFMIPGIIKSIEYSIINYILAENPDIKSKDAFKMAKEIMTGNKRRLFLLELSFIGWYFVGMLIFFVGIFFVAAYTEAATAQFYMDIKAHSGYGDASFTEKYDIDRIDDGDTFGI